VRKLSHKLIAIVSALAAVTLSAGTASADHYHTFTQGAEYFEATDNNGHFTAQANMHAGYVVPMPWSFRVSGAVQSIATSTMNCTAGVPLLHVLRTLRTLRGWFPQRAGDRAGLAAMVRGCALRTPEPWQAYAAGVTFTPSITNTRVSFGLMPCPPCP